jgi:GTP cyclohydrolase II
MVKRGLAEFRAGRPVIFSSGTANFLIALPVDGLTPARLDAFAGLAAPGKPRLVVTARRVCALGVDADGPVVLPLPRNATPEDIASLVGDADAAPVDAASVKPAGATAEAAIELAKLAQKLPALLVAETTSTQTVIDPPLVVVSASAVTKFRRDMMHALEIAGEAKVPLAGGIDTRFVVFRDAIGGGSAAVIVGKPDFSKPVPVRLHSACLTGDVFGSSRCDCGDQLRLALTRLKEEGGGIILYLDQEGRGLGLANKMRAYALQDEGLDTVDANTTLGFDDDERDYRVAARMLQMLGVKRVLLMTNNPAKLDGLTEAGIEVSGRKALQAPVNVHNRRYLTAKAMRAGHKLDHLFGALTEAGDGKGAVPAE